MSRTLSDLPRDVVRSLSEYLTTREQGRLLMTSKSMDFADINELKIYHSFEELYTLMERFVREQTTYHFMDNVNKILQVIKTIQKTAKGQYNVPFEDASDGIVDLLDLVEHIEATMKHEKEIAERVFSQVYGGLVTPGDMDKVYEAMDYVGYVLSSIENKKYLPFPKSY